MIVPQKRRDNTHLTPHAPRARVQPVHPLEDLPRHHQHQARDEYVLQHQNTICSSDDEGEAAARRELENIRRAHRGRRRDPTNHLHHLLGRGPRVLSQQCSRCLVNNHAREEVKEETNLEKVFAKLQKRFRPTGSAVFQQLDRRYHELSLDECKGVSDFAEKLREARTELLDLLASSLRILLFRP
jgi:hypothetical protein